LNLVSDESVLTLHHIPALQYGETGIEPAPPDPCRGFVLPVTLYKLAKKSQGLSALLRGESGGDQELNLMSGTLCWRCTTPPLLDMKRPGPPRHISGFGVQQTSPYRPAAGLAPHTIQAGGEKSMFPGPGPYHATGW
jgi:hypothetical protein